jgi:hypothetical protein
MTIHSVSHNDESLCSAFCQWRTSRPWPIPCCQPLLSKPRTQRVQQGDIRKVRKDDAMTKAWVSIDTAAIQGSSAQWYSNAPCCGEEKQLLNTPRLRYTIRSRLKPGRTLQPAYHGTPYPMAALEQTVDAAIQMGLVFASRLLNIFRNADSDM